MAATYKNYFKLWFDNKANNYHHSDSDETGFLNPLRMICVDLPYVDTFLSEATGDAVYINMAKNIYDTHIITRHGQMLKEPDCLGKSDDKSRKCLYKLSWLFSCCQAVYRKFGGENYLEDAKMLYKYIVGSLLKSDGRVEEPPLTYTQGTFERHADNYIILRRNGNI